MLLHGQAPRAWPRRAGSPIRLGEAQVRTSQADGAWNALEPQQSLIPRDEA